MCELVIYYELFVNTRSRHSAVDSRRYSVTVVVTSGCRNTTASYHHDSTKYAAGVMHKTIPLTKVTPNRTDISGRITSWRQKVIRPVIKVTPRHETKYPP